MGATTPQAGTSNPMTMRTLRTFFIATFAVSWGIGVLVSVFPDQAEALFGPMGYTNPSCSTPSSTGRPGPTRSRGTCTCSSSSRWSSCW